MFAEMKEGKIIAVWLMTKTRLGDSRPQRLFVNGNGKLVTSFGFLKEVDGKTEVCWLGGCHDALIYGGKELGPVWENRTNLPKVVVTEKNGKGYSGGHVTAMKEGWDTEYPVPDPDCIVWWDDTYEGHCTGYYPAISQLKPLAG